MNGRRVSSPASTGGAATVFEHHVGAYWLAQLLVRAIPPVLRDCAVVEVHFQTEHRGWNTDDFLMVGENGAGARRALAGPVKRGFTLSVADEECRQAIGDFWRDFVTANPFSPATDRFALVTLRGTDTLLQHFAALFRAKARRGGQHPFFERVAEPVGSNSIRAPLACNPTIALSRGLYTCCAVTTTENGTPIASKWRFPQFTLSASGVRSFVKSIVLSVSFTRYSVACPSSLRIAQSGLYPPTGVSTTNQRGSLTNSLISSRASSCLANSRSISES